MLTRGMFDLAPSPAEKLVSNMWRKAEPVLEPLPMYCIRVTACWTSCAVVYWPRVNSARTFVEYWRRPTCVPVLEMSSESTMVFTNCLTSSKLAGPRLLEPSITKTRSMTPSPHSGSNRHQNHLYASLCKRNVEGSCLRSYFGSSFHPQPTQSLQNICRRRRYWCWHTGAHSHSSLSDTHPDLECCRQTWVCVECAVFLHGSMESPQRHK